MNKITASLSLIALCLLATVSCKKKDNGKNNNTPASNTRTWTVDGTTYTVANANTNDNSFAFVDASNASLSFFFKSYPTTSKTYKVSWGSPEADEVSIMVSTGTPFMLGNPESGTVNVTVADGKVSIKCSSISFVKRNATADSIGTGKLSADLYY